MKRNNLPVIKLCPYLLVLIIFTACNASDSVNNYESKDTASGPRIDKEHMKALPDTTQYPEKPRDSASLRVPPPGETDTTKLNMQ